MPHKRGEITSHNDGIFKEGTYYKIYTGCQYLDDYYIAEDKETALRVSNELKERVNNELAR
jgi:hypothetical protein